MHTAYENEKWDIDKFLSLQYFKFEVVDKKLIMNQIHELQILFSKLGDLKVKISDTL